VHNAVSPHTEIGLDPDSQYSVSVRSISRRGESLPSTAILFHTKSDNRGKGVPSSAVPAILARLVSNARTWKMNRTAVRKVGIVCQTF
ncbi:hypothetical protein ANCDUO_21601, partial [Ancylostoma duodenale]